MSRRSSAVVQKACKSYFIISLSLSLWSVYWERGSISQRCHEDDKRQTWKEPTDHSLWQPINRSFPLFSSLKQTTGLGLISLSYTRCKDPTPVDIRNIYFWVDLLFLGPETLPSTFPILGLLPLIPYFWLIASPFPASTGRVNSLFPRTSEKKRYQREE